jgi:leader peptidase (prepilin peptidase)/N-methyltransferase
VQTPTAEQSVRAAAVAAGVALEVAILLIHRTTVQRVLDMVLVAVLVPITVIDIESRRIPNVITGPAALAAIVIGLVLHPSGVGWQLLGGLIGGGFLLIFALVYPAGLGMGDVKLTGMMGLYLSKSIVVGLFAGLLASAVFSVGVIVARGRERGLKTKIPLGPFLALGGVIAIFVGPTIIAHWHTL